MLKDSASCINFPNALLIRMERGVNDPRVEGVTYLRLVEESFDVRVEICGNLCPCLVGRREEGVARRNTGEGWNRGAHRIQRASRQRERRRANFRDDATVKEARGAVCRRACRTGHDEGDHSCHGTHTRATLHIPWSHHCAKLSQREE